ncbi:hypothetical protein B9Z55_017266 [Caenorhabditis nigoni]|uniref:Peptidase M16 C-terminal domain-containing protein n=1 Tax=Caenorhabditis nigoni TaxID=1611254 RepID=A0A2G5T8C8_9PELO|nr:hypothetical protein B9Z55_017266 [Caenorhabditis nigoni]
MCLKFVVTCPVVYQDPRSSLLFKLWLWCLGDILSEETYYTDLANLNGDVDYSLYGVEVKVNGYNEKQYQFTKDLTKRMVNFKIDKTRYDVVLASLMEALTDHALSQPISLCPYYYQLIVSDKTWSKKQLLAECDTVTLEDVQNFVKEMFSAFHLEIFVYGNSTEKEALELSKELVEILKTASPNPRPLYRNEHCRRREVQLNNGDEYIYRHLQTTHDIGCVDVSYQIGVQNTNDYAVLSLIDHLIEEPAFDTLRTKEALGYTVRSEFGSNCGVLFLSIIVQGPNSVDHVLERIEVFLETVRKEIEEMSQEEFEKQVSGVISELEMKPKTLSAQFHRFWYQIKCRQYDFADPEAEVNVLKTIKKEEVLAFYDRQEMLTLFQSKEV